MLRTSTNGWICSLNYPTTTRANTTEMCLKCTLHSVPYVHSAYLESVQRKQWFSYPRALFNVNFTEKKLISTLHRKISVTFALGISLVQLWRVIIKGISWETEDHKEKKAAKETANSQQLVITTDLQKVLMCLKLSASSLYYKLTTSPSVFVNLYIWHVVNGGHDSK
jgi:uncharacterized protein Usg